MTTKQTKKNKADLLPIIRTEGFFTILGRLDGGALKPLLHMPIFDNREEAEARCKHYGEGEPQVDWLVFQLVSEVNRR